MKDKIRELMELADAYLEQDKPRKAHECYMEVALMGDAAGQCCVAHDFLNGYGVKRDVKHGIRWYEKAAEQGDPHALNVLAGFYGEGEYVKKNAEKAKALYKQCFERAAEIVESDPKDVRALMTLASFYLTGNLVPKDLEKAKNYYAMAAEQGDASANMLLNFFFMENGENSADEEDMTEDEGFRMIEDDEDLESSLAAAQSGDPEAQTRLGELYLSGNELIGVPVDKGKAVEWFSKAAKQGYIDAEVAMGVCYDQGLGVENNAAEAAKWFLSAAKKGDADAQFRYGQMCVEGVLDNVSAQEGRSWLLKALEQGLTVASVPLAEMLLQEEKFPAKQKNAIMNALKEEAIMGNALAQTILALCYRIGCGVKVNYLEAAKNFRAAADEGIPHAMFSLGELYLEGLGVAKDEKKAFKLIKKAADEDFYLANHYMGVFYMTGQAGVKRDLKKARFYLTRAVMQGCDEAQEYLDLL